jgi:succinyl-diaminopimelate desuccinylase
LRGDLALALTAGEEVDCIGANLLVRQGLLMGAGSLIIAEPTDMDVCIAEKGAMWIEAIIRGKAAHGSSPHLGQNAIIPMADFVQKVARLSHPFFTHPLLGGSTMNIGTIEGGFRTNVVPDLCRLTIDFRTVPGQDHQHMYRMVRELMEEAAGNAGVEWEVNMIADRLPVDTPADDPFVKLFAEAAQHVLKREPSICGVSYFTDGAILSQALQVPMVICGPGEAAVAHQANESVKIDNLRLAARTYAMAAASLLL